MKKRNLKNLRLHTYKISNLRLLHCAVGGTETTTQVDTNPSVPQTLEATNCETNILQCASLNFDECSTNGGTTRTKPPTEYETCNPNNAVIIF